MKNGNCRIAAGEKLTKLEKNSSSIAKNEC
jgi:hypothetical protein